jgi:putative transposase
VRIFNDVHRRTRTLWEGRYKAAMVDSERYLLTCHRYIELNPVRAGLVGAPSDYRWSSHRHYALGFANPLLTAHAVQRRLAIDDTERRSAYLALFKQAIQPDETELIRTATNKRGRRICPADRSAAWPPGARAEAWPAAEFATCRSRSSD